MTNEEREKLEELLRVADSQHVSWFIADGANELRRGVNGKLQKDSAELKKAFDNDAPKPNP